MTAKVILQPAYVLHTRAYRNTSLLVEVFTAEHGRFCLVARGVRNTRSARAGLLQPFRSLLISWTGRGDLKTLIDVEAGDIILNLRGNLLMSGYYLNELLMRLLHPYDPHETLFDSYQRTLKALSDNAGDRHTEEITLRLYEKSLLDELGYGLILDHEVVSGEAIQPEISYQYLLNQGPVANEKKNHVDGIHINGSALLSLSSGHFDNDADLAVCKRLMRHVLRELLGDKPLYSRKLYNKIATQQIVSGE